MSDTKNIEVLNIAREVSDAQEASGNWNEIYMSNDGLYMRLTHTRNMMAVTVNVRADKIDIQMSHDRTDIEKSIEKTAKALNSTINTLHDDCLAANPPRAFAS